jgi:enoyl-CoA hydratase
MPKHRSRSGTGHYPIGDMTYETLLCQRDEAGCLVVTINRPEVRNAFNTTAAEELRAIFGPLRFTPGDLRCVVITGSGNLAFCSGADLKERKGMSENAWRLQHAIFEEAFYAIMECPVPVIAAVNGVAYAGGCELALACDFIYASSTARFAMTETSLGIVPGVGGTQNLPRAVGERRAKELILTARPFSAQEAYEWGMVNTICEPQALMPTVMEVARRICANAPVAVTQAKKVIHHGMQVNLQTGLRLEVLAHERAAATEDRVEGILAFNEKRPPRFRGV